MCCTLQSRQLQHDGRTPSLTLASCNCRQVCIPFLTVARRTLTRSLAGQRQEAPESPAAGGAATQSFTLNKYVCSSAAATQLHGVNRKVCGQRLVFSEGMGVMQHQHQHQTRQRWCVQLLQSLQPLLLLMASCQLARQLAVHG
jgi:hypothetical protein